MTKRFRRNVVIAAGMLLIAPLAACSSGPEGPETASLTETETEAPVPSGAETITDLFEKIGCKENDILGTDGMIDEAGDFGHDPAATHTGTCRPIEGGGTIYFFQYASPEEAREAASNGSIESYPDELFIDGSVLALATSAAEQTLLNAVAEPAG